MEGIMKGLNIAKIAEDVLNRKKKVVITDAEAKGKQITIKALFKDYNDDYKPTEIDWGSPKGNEM